MELEAIWQSATSIFAENRNVILGSFLVWSAIHIVGRFIVSRIKVTKPEGSSGHEFKDPKEELPVMAVAFFFSCWVSVATIQGIWSLEEQHFADTTAAERVYLHSPSRLFGFTTELNTARPNNTNLPVAIVCLHLQCPNLCSK